MKSIRHYIHPFPARMAPEIALRHLEHLPKGAVVLDPMSGSGTVVRLASQCGHFARGFDVDPLAVLISKAATLKWVAGDIASTGEHIVHCAKSISNKDVALPWIDEDEETLKFVNFWFGRRQLLPLRKLAYVINQPRKSGRRPHLQIAMSIALSRIIVTKQAGASMAWDVSHSRPHKVDQDNQYDVFEGFLKSCEELDLRLNAAPQPIGQADIQLGDARRMGDIKTNSVDAVITSPPYLNAIDYMRGHRLSLVWLGFSIPQLREIRSNSIGAERSLRNCFGTKGHKTVLQAFGRVQQLPNQILGVLDRYANDLILLSRELRRVIKKDGEIHLVVGDSMLRGVRVSNSKATIAAAETAGLKLVSRRIRSIPRTSRYLPTAGDSPSALQKRMMREHVLSFCRA